MKTKTSKIAKRTIAFQQQQKQKTYMTKCWNEECYCTHIMCALCTFFFFVIFHAVRQINKLKCIYIFIWVVWRRGNGNCMPFEMQDANRCIAITINLKCMLRCLRTIQSTRRYGFRTTILNSVVGFTHATALMRLAYDHNHECLWLVGLDI